MNEQQFWRKLQQTIARSDKPEIAQFQSERLVELTANPANPTKLITQTVCNGPIYLTERATLNFPTINPTVSLTANQQLALEMALSNSAIALIVGVPATGKTRIARNLANAAINFSQRVLILTHSKTALNAYSNLPGYPFWLNQQQDYREWIIEQLRSRHLSQPQMDYLPLQLLADTELAKLRTPARLEKWLPIIQTETVQILTGLLQQAFPDLNTTRVQLLAYRLKQLEPLLQQQLRLSQLYGNLSEQGIAELSDQLAENPQVPIIGTLAEFMLPEYEFLWQTTFDLIIVEEAHYLSCIELILLSGLGQKLALFGDEIPRRYPTSSQSSFFTCPYSFNWLAQHLLPAYRYQLTEQFRLHPEIAKLVYPVIGDRWVQTLFSPIHYDLPQLRHRLVWHDVPNQTEGEHIVKFLQSLNPQLSSQIGIITFCPQERDQLQANLRKFSEILIATVTEWAGLERAISIVSFAGNPAMTQEDINTALTRGQDYLIFFGNYEHWRQLASPIRTLLAQPLYKERMVLLS
ncbi:MAG: hypothetical protein H0X31_20930 [Nostocaceae cyanobacterium]|nr:hypothetical protein [Nostocaceae cyanobacterium]